MVLLRIALRNLYLQRFKTLLIGAILVMGTVLVVVGSGILDAVDTAMKTSVVNSVTAHIQIYNEDADETFQVFGNLDGSMPDIGRMKNFPRIEAALRTIPNVRTVVPMGIDFAVTTTDNMLERKLEALRNAIKKKNRDRIAPLKEHVRNIIAVLDGEMRNASALVDLKAYTRAYGDYQPLLDKALSDSFWMDFDASPNESLEFLENEVGPLALSEDMIWIRYLGTDTRLFKDTFDRFEIVDGKMIPPGKRGFLFNKRVYEEFVKNKTARRLDQIRQRIAEGSSIADCDDCKTWIGHNVKQAASLVFQFDRQAREKIKPLLQHLLGSKEADLVALTKQFMQMDDATFEKRFQFFYAQIAPNISLYSVGIGDEFVLTGFARGGGYSRKVPIKVYGTFRFRSLDRSPLAGGFNVMDIVSFRDLYGYMTEEKRAEQQRIRKAAGVVDVGRGDVEKLFDDNDKDLEIASSSKPIAIETQVDMRAGGHRYTKAIHQRTYSEKELHGGVVLNAAVMLKDGSLEQQTIEEIRRLNKEKRLGIKAIGWREASGTVGQMIAVIRAVLLGAVLIIFIVALIIINNSLLMATMERTREIGTMRAIGAQQGFVMRMFLLETGVLAAIFGTLGVTIGAAIMLFLEAKGIPATGDIFYFLYAGPRLRPPLQGTHMTIAFAAIAAVALVSTIYPARVATRITPREAMAAEE